ncbi:hypothetical protein EV360DRAFT_50558, partial [Lentinula raphanica]
QHHSLAWTMLHNAIIGPETIHHPYFAAFMNGFYLPCGVLGPNLSEISQRFCGGPSEFVTTLLQTRITGDYTMLRIDYKSKISDSMQVALQEALQTTFPSLADKGFPAIFRAFLEGPGLPPSLSLQELQDKFAETVPVDGVNRKGYRMRMFCWASTGVPHILLDGSAIEVSLVADNDPQYYRVFDDPHGEEAMPFVNNGTCCFKTCVRSMLIPASYFLRLLQAPSNNPQMIMDSISSWLLLEILNGIGNYNIM